MQHIKAPSYSYQITQDQPSVFFAGAIDMGQAVDWQTELANYLSDTNVVIFNPRRDDWNSSWKQDSSNPQFYEQVSWELNHLNLVDYAAFVFPKDSKAPISFMELGLTIGKKPCLIYVHPEFYRKGNIDIVVGRHPHNAKIYSDWDLFKNKLKELVNEHPKKKRQP